MTGEEITREAIEEKVALAREEGKREASEQVQLLAKILQGRIRLGDTSLTIDLKNILSEQLNPREKEILEGFRRS